MLLCYLAEYSQGTLQFLFGSIANVEKKANEFEIVKFSSCEANLLEVGCRQSRTKKPC